MPKRARKQKRPDRAPDEILNAFQRSRDYDVRRVEQTRHGSAHLVMLDHLEIMRRNNVITAPQLAAARTFTQWAMEHLGSPAPKSCLNHDKGGADNADESPARIRACERWKEIYGALTGAGRACHAEVLRVCWQGEKTRDVRALQCGLLVLVDVLDAGR